MASPKRPTITEYYLSDLERVASRGTCARRLVGAILTDEQGRVLATGYNGPPSGFPHCRYGHPCEGAYDPPGQTSRCLAVHAEQNAIVQAGLSGNLERAAILYCSASPCEGCAKLLCALPHLRDIFCLERYADQRGLTILRRRQICVWLRIEADKFEELKGEENEA